MTSAPVSGCASVSSGPSARPCFLPALPSHPYFPFASSLLPSPLSISPPFYSISSFSSPPFSSLPFHSSLPFSSSLSFSSSLPFFSSPPHDRYSIPSYFSSPLFLLPPYSTFLSPFFPSRLFLILPSQFPFFCLSSFPSFPYSHFPLHLFPPLFSPYLISPFIPPPPISLPLSPLHFPSLTLLPSRPKPARASRPTHHPTASFTQISTMESDNLSRLTE